MIPIADLLNDHQMFHSDVQMDAFITVRAGGTVYGQYKQALRELSKRFRGLTGLYHDRQLAELDIEVLKSGPKGNNFALRRRDIEISRARFGLEQTDHTIKDTEREFLRFYAQAVVLKRKIEAEHGEFTEEVRAKLDAEMWEYQIQQTIAVDILAGGRVSSSAITMLRSWGNRKFADPILGAIRENSGESLGKLVAFVTEQQPPQLPAYNGALKGVTVKGLLDG